MYLLSGLSRPVVQPKTAHFHTQHLLRHVIYLHVVWLIHRFEFHPWVPRMNIVGKLDVPQNFKEQHFWCSVFIVHIFGVRQRWTARQHASMAFWFLFACSTHGAYLLWRNRPRGQEKLGLARTIRKARLRLSWLASECTLNRSISSSISHVYPAGYYIIDNIIIIITIFYIIHKFFRYSPFPVISAKILIIAIN